MFLSLPGMASALGRSRSSPLPAATTADGALAPPGMSDFALPSRKPGTAWRGGRRLGLMGSPTRDSLIAFHVKLP
jgi:hypothetical protein